MTYKKQNLSLSVCLQKRGALELSFHRNERVSNKKKAGSYIEGNSCPGDSQLFDAEAISGCRNALGFIYVLIDEEVPDRWTMGNIEGEGEN